MAGDLRAFALEEAELLSSRLKELLSSGQGYVQTRLGVDLGLKPELYPTWAVLSTAVLGLLLLLSVSWAAVRGGLLAGKKRRSSNSQGGGEAGKAEQEEPRRRNRKKNAEKVSFDNKKRCHVSFGQSGQVLAFDVSKQSVLIKCIHRWRLIYKLRSLIHWKQPCHLAVTRHRHKLVANFVYDTRIKHN